MKNFRMKIIFAVLLVWSGALSAFGQTGGGFNQSLFDKFIDMRVGSGAPIYWYCVGELYSYPEGKLLAKVEGIDTARLVRESRTADRAQQISRKIFIYRDPVTSEVLKVVNNRPVQHIEYPYQFITYQLKGSEVVSTVEQGAGARKQVVGPVPGMTARQFGPSLMFSAPLFLNFNTPRGKYEAYENYDFYLQPKAKTSVSPYYYCVKQIGILCPSMLT